MSEHQSRYNVTGREILDSIEEWLEEISSESPDSIFLVEGKKDIAALRELGIEHRIIPLNKGMNVFDLVENISRGNIEEMDGPLEGKLIILTDWDRKGGQLASRVEKACLHLDVDHDLVHRKNISIAIGKWVRDIESIPSFISSLDL